MEWPQWLLDLMEGARVLWGGIALQAEFNPAFRIILYLIGACILILVVMWLFPPSPKQQKMKETRRRGVYGHATAQPNPTNGMEHALFGYPVVYRLMSQDGEDAGQYLKKAPGPDALLRLGARVFKVLSLRQLTEKQIAEIEKVLAKQGKISFQGEEWDLVKEVSLNVEVVAGTPPYFPGKVGMIDYKIASRGEDDDELILLENPYIPNKPSKLRTWTGSLLEGISLEEFAALSKEVLEITPAGK